MLHCSLGGSASPIPPAAPMPLRLLSMQKAAILHHRANELVDTNWHGLLRQGAAKWQTSKRSGMSPTTGMYSAFARLEGLSGDAGCGECPPCVDATVGSYTFPFRWRRRLVDQHLRPLAVRRAGSELRPLACPGRRNLPGVAGGGPATGPADAPALGCRSGSRAGLAALGGTRSNQASLSSTGTGVSS